MKFIIIPTAISIALLLNSCKEQHEHVEVHHKIVATSPVKRDITTTQEYVCQIHSCRHIEVKALERGYLESISVKEGQLVNQGDPLFKILPILYQAELDAEKAEARLTELEYKNTQKLLDDNVVSSNELALAKAKLDKANAKVALSQAHLDFTDIKAPFSGITDRLLNQKGSLIEEGDILTTLSDNSTMWVYFNVPEARYLQYTADISGNKNISVELKLANQKMFPQAGKINAIEADFNNETGNIAFRADFPNPDRLLRNGQTGTIIIGHPVKNAILIPQRATFEILDRRYVYVLSEDNIVHQQEIVIKNELEDQYVIKSGLTEKDRIILEGVRQVHDGEEAEVEMADPDEVIDHLKTEAE